MLVYTLKDNDPLRVPEFQYLADPVCLDEERDVFGRVGPRDSRRIGVDSGVAKLLGFRDPLGHQLIHCPVSPSTTRTGRWNAA